jgi:3-oxoacyl-[acyl-carrier protein] reductase
VKHIVVVGGGGALAQHVLDRWLGLWNDWEVTCIYRTNKPERSRHARTVHYLTDVPGLIDLLVCMPGTDCAVKLDRASDEEWQRVLDANLLSVARAFRELLPKMTEGGNVVVVGSVMGRLGGYGCGPYAAAKAGLVGLVRAAANEHARRRVVVNLLELGHVDAGMGARLPAEVRERALKQIPLGRFAQPSEVVEAIDYLARVRFMTGQVLPLTGGL